MDMETSLACSSAAAVALFAASFFSLSALPRVSVCRRSTSAAHAVFVQPGGLSFGPRLPRLQRAVIGDLFRRHGGGREEEELQLWGNSAGKVGICGAFWRETK
jgi:hypothetical protein